VRIRAFPQISHSEAIHLLLIWELGLSDNIT